MFTLGIFLFHTLFTNRKRFFALYLRVEFNGNIDVWSDLV